MGEKPLRSWFDKKDGFNKIDNGIRYLVLDHSRFDKICDSINYFINEKSGITDNINHTFARVRMD